MRALILLLELTCLLYRMHAQCGANCTSCVSQGNCNNDDNCIWLNSACQVDCTDCSNCDDFGTDCNNFVEDCFYLDTPIYTECNNLCEPCSDCDGDERSCRFNRYCSYDAELDECQTIQCDPCSLCDDSQGTCEGEENDNGDSCFFDLATSECINLCTPCSDCNDDPSSCQANDFCLYDAENQECNAIVCEPCSVCNGSESACQDPLNNDTCIYEVTPSECHNRCQPCSDCHGDEASCNFNEFCSYEDGLCDPIVCDPCVDCDGSQITCEDDLNVDNCIWQTLSDNSTVCNARCDLCGDCDVDERSCDSNDFCAFNDDSGDCEPIICDPCGFCDGSLEACANSPDCYYRVGAVIPMECNNLCQACEDCDGDQRSCDLQADCEWRTETNTCSILPTSAPTAAPTGYPTSAPTSAPTDNPSASPTSLPTESPLPLDEAALVLCAGDAHNPSSINMATLDIPNSDADRSYIDLEPNDYIIDANSALNFCRDTFGDRSYPMFPFDSHIYDAMSFLCDAKGDTGTAGDECYFGLYRDIDDIRELVPGQDLELCDTFRAWDGTTFPSDTSYFEWSMSPQHPLCWMRDQTDTNNQAHCMLYDPSANPATTTGQVQMLNCRLIRHIICRYDGDLCSPYQAPTPSPTALPTPGPSTRPTLSPTPRDSQCRVLSAGSELNPSTLDIAMLDIAENDNDITNIDFQPNDVIDNTIDADDAEKWCQMIFGAASYPMAPFEEDMYIAMQNICDTKNSADATDDCYFGLFRGVDNFGTDTGDCTTWTDSNGNSYSTATSYFSFRAGEPKCSWSDPPSSSNKKVHCMTYRPLAKGSEPQTLQASACGGQRHIICKFDGICNPDDATFDLEQELADLALPQ